MVTDLQGMRICFIAGSLGRGGAERQLFYTLKALTAMGAKCLVLSFTSNEFYEQHIRELNVDVHYLGPSDNKLGRLYRIIRHLRKWMPHIIQSTHSFVNPYVILSARWLSCVDIGALRTDYRREIRRYGFWGRVSLNCVTRLVLNSRAALDYAREASISPTRLYLLENVVDTSSFQPKLDSCSSANIQTITILNVGSLRRVKRQDVFLHAFARAVQVKSTLRARIVGSGHLRKSLENLVEALRLSPAVEFMGSLDDMPSVYQNADIFVHTSDFEGMPNVILEAMSCALPVIATRAGAAHDLVEDGKTGYLVDIGSIEEIAAKIISLSSDHELRVEMGRNARAKICTEYALSNLDSRLLSLYGPLFRQIHHSGP